MDLGHGPQHQSWRPLQAKPDCQKDTERMIRNFMHLLHPCFWSLLSAQPTLATAFTSPPGEGFPCYMETLILIRNMGVHSSLPSEIAPLSISKFAIAVAILQVIKNVQACKYGAAPLTPLRNVPNPFSNERGNLLALLFPTSCHPFEWSDYKKTTLSYRLWPGRVRWVASEKPSKIRKLIRKRKCRTSFQKWRQQSFQIRPWVLGYLTPKIS